MANTTILFYAIYEGGCYLDLHNHPIYFFTTGGKGGDSTFSTHFSTDRPRKYERNPVFSTEFFRWKKLDCGIPGRRAGLHNQKNSERMRNFTPSAACGRKADANPAPARKISTNGKVPPVFRHMVPKTDGACCFLFMVCAGFRQLLPLERRFWHAADGADPVGRQRFK